MSKQEKQVRRAVRQVIKEELSPSEKTSVLEDLEIEVENVVSSVLIDHGVHKKGLSDQQCAKLFRELTDVLKDTLDEFKTTRKPSEIEGFENYENYINRL
jgi:hypothetical protein